MIVFLMKLRFPDGFSAFLVDSCSIRRRPGGLIIP